MKTPSWLRRPRFSLRTLLVLITSLCAALAVWSWLPDGNNTLPIARLVPPELRPTGVAANDPHLVLLEVKDPPRVDGRKPQRQYEFAIVNPTPYTLIYRGERVDPWRHANSWGDIHPIYDWEEESSGGWSLVPTLRCGTGLTTLAIKPGHAGKFTAYDRDLNRVRVVFHCTWFDELGAKHAASIASEPL